MKNEESELNAIKLAASQIVADVNYNISHATTIRFGDEDALRFTEIISKALVNVQGCTCEYYWHNPLDHDRVCPVAQGEVVLIDREGAPDTAVGEARKCVKCGHAKGDPRRRGSDAFGSFCIYGCGCKCEFAPVATGDDEIEKRARQIVDNFRYASPPVQSLRFLEWEPLVSAIAAALRKGEGK